MQKTLGIFKNNKILIKTLLVFQIRRVVQFGSEYSFYINL